MMALSLRGRSGDSSRETLTMKRMGWASSSLTVVALLLSACSDSGPKTLSEDDFIDELNSICDDASRDLRRLDGADRNFFDDVLEIMQSSAEALAKLSPPSDLKGDYDDFVDNLDDTIKETENIRDAVDDDDQAAIEDSSAELSNLNDDGNDLADSLGADDCIDIGSGSGGSTDSSDPDNTDPASTDPDTTTANTPLPIDPTVPTDPPATDPPDPTTAPTPAPTTAPVPEMTVPESNSGGSQALDITTEFLPPAGFEWVQIDITGISAPSSPLLVPIIDSYFFGRAENAATGEIALLSLTILNLAEGQQWTEEQLAEMADYELLSGSPTEVASAAGRTVYVAQGVGEAGDLDAGVSFLERASVGLLVFPGSDVLGIIDAFFAANLMGG